MNRNLFKRLICLLLALVMVAGMVPAPAQAADAAQADDNPWSGKSAVFVGDSITAGTGTTKIYYEYLKEALGFGSVSAMGVPGSCISAASDYGQSTQPLISRYQNIPSADLIMVFMGTNDYGHETPLGNVSDTGDGTFYGVLNTIVSSLVARHTSSKIVFVTPLHRYGFGTSKILGTPFTYDNIPNGAGASLADYAGAVKTVCENHNVSVIDLYTECTIDPTDAAVRSELIPDGLHPNAAGHAVIAGIMESHIREYAPMEAPHTHTYENGICTGCGETMPMLDSIAWEDLSYRDIFITNNKAYLDGFNNKTFSPYVQNTGTNIVTNTACYTGPYSLAAFGSPSQQIKSVNQLPVGQYFVASKVYCTRYAAGELGVCLHNTAVGVTEETEGFVTSAGIVSLQTSGNIFIGSIHSANLDGYVDDTAVIDM